MSTPLESAVAFALRQLLAAAGRQVTYRRGAQSVSVRMAPGETLTQLADQEGSMIVVRLQDWIGRASDLVIGGEQILPQPGDLIVDSGSEDTYQVVPPPGETQYRPPRLGIDRIRIHTQRTAPTP